MAPQERLELPTRRLEICYSIQLSYWGRWVAPAVTEDLGGGWEVCLSFTNWLYSRSGGGDLLEFHDGADDGTRTRKIPCLEGRYVSHYTTSAFNAMVKVP